MFAGDKIANGCAPFNYATAFRASELETKQTPGSEMFKSDTEPKTGTGHPSFKSLSFTGEKTAGTRLTGVQPGFSGPLDTSFFLLNFRIPAWNMRHWTDWRWRLDLC